VSIEPGQVWVNTANGRQVVVEEYSAEWDDVTVREVKGGRRRSIYGLNLQARYRLEEQ
jgi:hypothetical protein